MSGEVVKFPIGPVVREHRIGRTCPTPELQAIEQAAISIRRAKISLRRQEATLNLLAARARKKVTPEQQAVAVAENMHRIYARQDEDADIRANADTDDGGSAA